MNDKDFKQSMDGLPQELERVYGKAWQTVATLDDLTAEDSRRHGENTKLETPKGKLTIRHRQMRGVWQCFAGRNYITGASGDNPAKMEGMDFIFNSANLPRDEAQTLAYYERTMSEIEKMLAETN